jgi:hypothetical protein
MFIQYYRSAFIHPFKNVQCGLFQITENFVHIQTGFEKSNDVLLSHFLESKLLLSAFFARIQAYISVKFVWFKRLSDSDQD